jgi:two-component system chemotaxis response regulator CheY
MSKTVLIADDSASIRNILKLTLEFKGYTVLEAEDGKAAYETLKSTACDLLISDIAMPSMSGLELLSKVRQTLQNKTLPVIICTAEKDIKEEEIIRRGANKVLIKPVSPRELLAIVEGLISTA